MKVIWQGSIRRLSTTEIETIRICSFDPGESPLGLPLPDGRCLQFLPSPSTGVVDWCAADAALVTDLDQWALLSELAEAGEASKAFALSPSEAHTPKRKAGKKAAISPLEAVSLTWQEKRVLEALEAAPSFAGKLKEPTKNTAAWLAAFPGLDIPQEIARANSWVINNPQSAPKSNSGRFIDSWLSRAFDRMDKSPGSDPLPIAEPEPARSASAGPAIRNEIKTLASRPFTGPRDARALASRVGSGMLASPTDSDQEIE